MSLKINKINMLMSCYINLEVSPFLKNKSKVYFSFFYSQKRIKWRPINIESYYAIIQVSSEGVKLSQIVQGQVK